MADENYTPLIPLLGHILFSVGSRNIPALKDKSLMLADLLHRIEFANKTGLLRNGHFSKDEISTLFTALEECARFEDDDFETIVGWTATEVREEIISLSM